MAEWKTMDTAPRERGAMIWGFRPSLTDPKGYWIATLVYDDGHWVDSTGAAFEPQLWRRYSKYFSKFPSPPRLSS